MVYTFLKNNIRDAYQQKQYEQCNQHLTNLYRIILIDKKIDWLTRDEIICYYYYYKVKILIDLNNLTNALTLCLKTFKYFTIDERDQYNSEYKLMLDLLGGIYEKLGKEKQAIKVYSYLLDLSNERDYEKIFGKINNLRKNSNIITFNNKQKKYNSNKESNCNFCCYF